jgi:hypothetical protein
MADFPSVAFTTMEVRNNTPTIVTTSISGLENRTQVGTQYWGFTATFQNLSDAERRQIMGFLMTKRGSLYPFTINLPEPFEDSTGNYAPSFTASTGAAGATTVTATILTSGANVFKSGDFVTFSNHKKLYMVTADATASGTALTFTVFPALRTSVAAATVTHKNVEMYVKCSSDQLSFSSDPNLFASMDIDFVEVIN